MVRATATGKFHAPHALRKQMHRSGKLKDVDVKTLTREGSGPAAPLEERPSGQLVKAREAIFEDYARIAALQIRYGLAARSFEDWSAFWNDNPAFRERAGHWPMGWVLETQSGEIVGSLINLPVMYDFQGRRLCAASGCSWVVDARYRCHSLSLMLRFLKQKDVQLFISATVGPNAEPALKLLHFSRLPVGNWQQSAFWITNYRGFSRSALTSKSVAFAPAISYPLSAALLCRDKFKFANRITGSPIQIELCSGFDNRFDEFWEELRRQNQKVLLGVRTRETLTWHFRDALIQQNAWILTASTGSRLVAYAVFDRQDKPAFGLRRIRLVDFQAIDGCQDALRSALLRMLHKCRRERIHVLEVMGSWLGRPEFPQVLPPHHRPLASWTYYYKANDPDLHEVLKNPAVWAPSSFDGDASLNGGLALD
jgi:hypothetical protein